MAKQQNDTSYPIIDLFAGPGGLGEGFASLTRKNKAIFKSAASFERDPYAHQTQGCSVLLSALEREIDEEVYRLYNLTPDEIALIENATKGAQKRAG